GLTNTYCALILPQIGAAVAFGSFWLRAYFRSVPRSVVEAARTDRASSWLALSRALPPLATPALLTLAVAQFLWTCSDSLLALVRPSGSGKAAALRMLAGLESGTAGEIHIDETVVNRVAPRERDIAMVFQDYGLYPQMTVFNNLAFGLRRRKIAKAEIEQRVH